MIDLDKVRQFVRDRRDHAPRGTVAWFMSTLGSKYSSYGCYPLFWLCSDGGTLSYEACRANCAQIARSIRDGSSDGWRVVACDANWEDPAMYCDHTGERIESAYAEDDACNCDQPGQVQCVQHGPRE